MNEGKRVIGAIYEDGTYQLFQPYGIIAAYVGAHSMVTDLSRVAVEQQPQEQQEEEEGSEK